MTQILIARHGQSLWNAEGRWQGRADPELSDLGRQQAFHAGQRVGVVDAIVASPLLRAFETARIIGDSLGVGPIVVEPDLVERDAGEWSGLTRVDIEAQWPGWIEEGRRPKGWESNEDVLVRIQGSLARVHEHFAGGEVLVVCHGGLIYALEEHHGDPLGRIPNLGARWARHGDAELTLGDRVLLIDEDEVTIPAQL